MVTWANLASSSLNWDAALQLVPAEVMAQSIPDLDHVLGPDATDVVPRRILELIRAQLDACAAEWFKTSAVQASSAELTQQVHLWAQEVLDQAKRVQQLKRPAEHQLTPPVDIPPPATPLAASAAAAASQPGTPLSSQQCPPTQLDATQVDAT